MGENAGNTLDAAERQRYLIAVEIRLNANGYLDRGRSGWILNLGREGDFTFLNGRPVLKVAGAVLNGRKER
ncbi:hypothetical protein [Sphingomonas sp. PB2P19]|uniref:hypothetical protein n=1 Tax=Sphingomonas rhamnosi TaxID=3096156 RepID=UPI002FC93EF3